MIDHPENDVSPLTPAFEAVGPGLLMFTSIVFILTYMRLPWARTMWGRSIMISAFAVFGLSLNTLLLRLDYLLDSDFSWAYFWPRVFAWIILAGVYAWQTAVALDSLHNPDE